MDAKTKKLVTDPLFDNDPWVVRLDLDGQVQHYAIERDLSPDRPVVASTFKLSDKDTTVMSHKHLLRAIDNHDRTQDILHAIASKYESFDQRGVWKLTLLPDGAKLHKMMLLIKVKMLADGTEERVKARAVLLGNDYRPGIDFGDVDAHWTASMEFTSESVEEGFKTMGLQKSYFFPSGRATKK